MAGRYKAYPEYKESGIEWLGKVPQGWSIHSLKRSVDGVTNGIWGNEPDNESDLIVLRVADFNRDQLNISDDKLTFRSIDPKDRASRLLKKGDLLIEKSGGGDKTLVGCVVLFDKDYPAVTSNFVAKMTPQEGFDSSFLRYAFSQLYAGKVNFPSIKQTTGIQNLDSDAYLLESFVFPSFTEQQKIANFLDHETAKIDTLIAKQEKLIELLKEKRQAVISHAVTKGLNPNAPMRDSGVEWLGEVPEHWGSSTVKNLCYVNDGNHGEEYPTESDFVDNRDGVPFIRAGDFDNLKIIENDLRYISHKKNDSMRKGRLQEGDILFVNRGATIGKLCIVDAPYAGSNLNSQIAYLRCNTNLADHRYVTYFLSSPYIQTKILAAIQGGALPQYPLKHIVNLDIWHGNIEEQKAISNFLDNKTNKIKGLIEKSELAINLIKERKTALISAAVTGKIDVRDFVSEQGQPQGV